MRAAALPPSRTDWRNEGASVQTKELNHQGTKAQSSEFMVLQCLLVRKLLRRARFGQNFCFPWCLCVLVVHLLLDDALDGLLVNVRMQHADERQVAVTLREVKAVADDKKIRNLKTDKIRLHLMRPARGLVEQHASFNAARLE